MVRIRSDMEGILAEHTGQSVHRLRSDTDHDRVFTAPQPKEYGLLDDVLRRRG